VDKEPIWRGTDRWQSYYCWRWNLCWYLFWHFFENT